MSSGGVLVFLGALAGAALSWWLARRSYRYADEHERSHRQTWWWMVPGTALAAGGVGQRLSDRPAVVLLTYLLALAVLAALIAIDIDVHRLPDSLTLPAYPVFAVLLALCSWASADWGAYRRAVICCAAMYVGYFLLAFASPGGSGLGFGDVKLAGVLGLLLGWLDWRLPLLATLGAFLLGGLFAIVLLVARRATRSSTIAFGPPMVFAAVTVMCTSPTLIARSLG